MKYDYVPMAKYTILYTEEAEGGLVVGVWNYLVR